MIKFLIYGFSKQLKPINQIAKRSLPIINELNQMPPTYTSFRKLNLSFNQTLNILDQLSDSPNLILVNNLLTYTRKNWGRQLLQSRQSYLENILNNLDKIQMAEDQANIFFPALFQNISYSYQPDLFLSRSLQHFMKYAPLMSISSISNTIYCIAKIARKSVQQDIDKIDLYNSSEISLIQLVPIIKLKTYDLNDLQSLTQCLIGYQKMELCDEIGDHLIQQIQKLDLQKGDFELIDAQLLHTLANYNAKVINKQQMEFQGIIEKLQDKLEDQLNKVNLSTMALSIHALNQLNQKLSIELLQHCQEVYCQKENQANIQDLSMICNVIFQHECIIPQFSQKITNHYEILRKHIDINIINRFIPNIAGVINKRYLEKKLINMILISIKILKDKSKVNQKLIQTFSKEMKLIENEEIKSKFSKVDFILTKQ